MTKNAKIVFKVVYVEDESIVELYAKHVSESDMFGFIAVEELIFGENATLVVDPSEERLKEQMRDVKRTYIPVHSIMRIDEVEKEGVAKIKPIAKNNQKVSSISSSLYLPKKGDHQEQD